MNIISKTLVNFIFIFFGFTSLYSQGCYTSENVRIEENFFNEDILGYYLSAIDFDTGQSDVLLFDLAIDFSNAIPNPNCTSFILPSECANLSCSLCNNILPVQCVGGDYAQPSLDHGIDKIYVNFKIEIFVSQFESFSEGLTTLAEGTVLLDNISPTTQRISFRNTDLSFDTKTLQDGATFSLIGNNPLTIDSNDIDAMTETFLSLGRIPNGTYKFSFDLLENNNNGDAIASFEKTIDIFIPTYINLISPGSSSLSDSSLTTVSMNNPIFQWNLDYCSNCDLSIRVSEYRSSIHSSLSEAIQDYSVLPIESGYYNLDPNINMFQYPSSDVNPLENGKLYVWQLKRSYGTTSGTVEELSDLFAFKVQSLEDVDNSQLTTDENLNNLKLLIGDSKYNELFGPDGQLYNFNSLHPLINVNGENMSITYLIELINMLNNNTINIIEVDVD